MRRNRTGRTARIRDDACGIVEDLRAFDEDPDRSASGRLDADAAAGAIRGSVVVNDAIEHVQLRGALLWRNLDCEAAEPGDFHVLEGQRRRSLNGVGTAGLS